MLDLIPEIDPLRHVFAYRGHKYMHMYAEIQYVRRRVKAICLRATAAPLATRSTAVHVLQWHVQHEERLRLRQSESPMHLSCGHTSLSDSCQISSCGHAHALPNMISATPCFEWNGFLINPEL